MDFRGLFETGVRRIYWFILVEPAEKPSNSGPVDTRKALPTLYAKGSF